MPYNFEIVVESEIRGRELRYNWLYAPSLRPLVTRNFQGDRSMTEPQPKNRRLTWTVLAAIAMTLVIGSLFYEPRSSVEAKTASVEPHVHREPASVREDGAITVLPDSPLTKRLQILEAQRQRVTYPLLRVTGSVIARIRSGEGQLDERWQFNSSELSTAYADWVRSKADVEFSKARLQKTKELVTAQETHYKSIVDRLAGIASDGVAQKDVTAARAQLLQSQLQGEKDIYEEESSLRTARQQHASFERELGQLGLEPIVLARGREGMVLVTAHVPESQIPLVREHQACEARFYSTPDKLYSAHVEHLGSILNSQRRTLRVLFDVTDTEERLRPGMFADVLLGTDPREAVMIPTAAVIHIGRQDYVFTEKSPGVYTLGLVEIAEPIDDNVEVLSGLAPGSRYIADGAILLKPLAVRSLAR